MSKNNYHLTQDEVEAEHSASLDHFLSDTAIHHIYEPRKSNSSESEYKYEYSPAREELREEQMDAFKEQNTLSPICNETAYDKLEGSYIKVSFVSLEHVTKEGNTNAGAILLDLAPPDSDAIKDHWFPKKLCVNLDLEARTVWVWDVFINDNKPELLE